MVFPSLANCGVGLSSGTSASFVRAWHGLMQSSRGLLPAMLHDVTGSATGQR